ncbi:MAG: hypothetical protein KDA55_11570, partial [Planctomycetales bacterium]|nr:hypothetical protein [Planctomycetales bacterium]
YVAVHRFYMAEHHFCMAVHHSDAALHRFDVPFHRFDMPYNDFDSLWHDFDGACNHFDKLEHHSSAPAFIPLPPALNSSAQKALSHALHRQTVMPDSRRPISASRRSTRQEMQPAAGFFARRPVDALAAYPPRK